MTDTNQASEDELQRELERLYRCVGYDLADGVDRKELWIKEVGVVVKRLIRTEKVKLLAEVRERVVGEYETEYSNLDGDAGYWEKHGRNGMREKQIADLAKLEAEL